MIILDIETMDTFQDYAHLPRSVQLLALTFGVASVYDTATHTVVQYWSPNLPRWEQVLGEDPARYGIAAVHQHASVLYQLWSDIKLGQPVAGWNVFEFDLALLILHLAQQHGMYAWTEMPLVIDPFLVLRRASRRLTGLERWYGLDVVARATLGRGKSGDGMLAAHQLASKQVEQVRAAACYCADDARLTADLLRVATEHGMRAPARPARNESGDLLAVWNGEQWHVSMDMDGTYVTVEALYA